MIHLLINVDRLKALNHEAMSMSLHRSQAEEQQPAQAAFNKVIAELKDNPVDISDNVQDIEKAQTM